MKIAHISDLHMSSPAGIGWPALLNKRLLGYLSWRYRRRHIHKRTTLDQLMVHIRRDTPDLLLISGDLTHLGVAKEYAQARAWLDDAAKDFKILLVPGNHDRYAAAKPEDTLAVWRAYYPGGSHDFPGMHIENGIAVIGLNTALPTAPFYATGRLGAGQLRRLTVLLDETQSQGLFRLLMLHHGPVPGSYGSRRRLVDEAAFIATIKQHGAELILHGHGHANVEHTIATRKNNIPALGAPSASALPSRHHPGAGYNRYLITPLAQGWQVHKQCLSLNMADDSMHTIEQGSYTLAAV